MWEVWCVLVGGIECRDWLLGIQAFWDCSSSGNIYCRRNPNSGHWEGHFCCHWTYRKGKVSGPGPKPPQEKGEINDGLAFTLIIISLITYKTWSIDFISFLFFSFGFCRRECSSVLSWCMIYHWLVGLWSVLVLLLQSLLCPTPQLVCWMLHAWAIKVMIQQLDHVQILHITKRGS